MTRARTRRETSAGGVVFRREGTGVRYLLILDSNGNWGFPKGHLNEGESPLDAARREVEEETGLVDLVLHGELGVIDWYFRVRGDLVHKHCHLYLLESPRGEVTPQLEEGITSCTWYGLDEALRTMPYENSRAVLKVAGSMVGRMPSVREPAGES